MITPQRPQPGRTASVWQRGQASVFVVVTAAVMLIAALTIYNAGQLNTARTQLQTTADATAYSGALLLSRSYNYAAYSNRAVVANQVAVAQMVGLASWSRYYCLTYSITTCGTYVTGTGIAIQTELESQPPGLPGILLFEGYQVLSSILYNVLENAIPPVIDTLEVVITALTAASQAYYTGVVAELGSGALGVGILADVVAANDPDASLSSFGMAAIGGTVFNIDTFISRYAPITSDAVGLTKDDGSRFHDLVTANLDAFSELRVTTETLPFPLVAVGPCEIGIGAVLLGSVYGGVTTLAADNRSWSADDAAVIAGLRVCGGVVYNPENTPPLVFVATAVPLVAPPPFAFATAGTPTVPNPLYDLNTRYSGLQPYLDVSDLDGESTESPTLTLYVRRGKESILTTEQLTASGQPVGIQQLELPDGEQGNIMQVGASANAYFAPPSDAAELDGNTVYGSLFSPYWEAHLVNTSLLSPFSTIAAGLLQ